MWAIDDRAAASLWHLASNMDLKQHVASAVPQPKAAIEMQPDGKGKSIAVIRMEGTLMKASSSLDGGTSTVQMRRDIRKAAADPDISGIMLAIDSPGGTVAGTADLAAEVKAATKAKPVYAFVSDLCASAAYWVASQADAIFANADTAMIGSIGTLVTVYDMSGMAGKQGVEALVFKTGSIKGAGTQGAPVTEEQRAYFQSIVDQSQKSFDEGVQKGRSLTDKQLASVRTGGVFLASEAQDRKLIDGVQSYEATLAALIKESSQRARSGRVVASEPAIPRGATMSAAVTATAPNETETMLANMRVAAAAEMDRHAAIRAACVGQEAIAAQAIRENWSLEKAELTALKASLPKPGATANPHTTSFGNGGQVNINTGAGKGVADAEVMEAALSISLGIKPDFVASHLPSDSREKVMNTATSKEFRGYTLHAVMGEIIHMAGHTYRGSHKTESYIRACKQAEFDLRAQGFSTVSLAGILSNVANKGLIESYQMVETTWQKFCAIRSHTDFKTNTRYRMDSQGSFKKVAQDGELKHINLTDASYTNKLETYGAMITLTRQQKINDDLSAFLELPRMMGRLDAIRIEEAVYVLFLSNPSSFFSTGNKNNITGGTSVLSLSSLTTAEATFANQVDSNNKPIGVMPKILLVGTNNKVTAESIFKNDKVQVTTTADAKTTDDNPHVGKFMPVSSPYINNTNIKDQDGAAISGQTSTGWFLFADPSARAAIGVAFLNGQQTPTIESAETSHETLGEQWRAYHDFGVGMEDPVAAQRNVGA